jgi:hypothetical protein
MSADTYRLYGAAELNAQLQAQFPAAWSPVWLNSHYCAATRGWVAGPFAKYFWEYLAARGDLKYRKRGNQCEHYALRAALEAVKLFADADDPKIPEEAESLAVAACEYVRADGTGKHEVNLWFVDGGWLPWEPQTRAFFEFTEAERLTVAKPIIL